MNKIIAILLLMLLPLTSFANEVPKISPINKGDTAPFSGVLYNTAATAEIIAQREFLIEQHKLNLGALKEKLDAECNLKVGNLQADLDSLKFKYNFVIRIKDHEIKKLQDIVVQQPYKRSHWWFGGGILTGILITVGIVHASK